MVRYYCNRLEPEISVRCNLAVACVSQRERTLCFRCLRRCLIRVIAVHIYCCNTIKYHQYYY